MAVPPAAAPASAPDADPALSAAFAAPELPGGLVRRPRLLRMVSEGLHRPLLMVNGPAGAGKSLLVADWSVAAAGGRAGPLAWLTAERGDDMPGVFFARLLRALRHAGLALPPELVEPAGSEKVGRPLLVRLAAHFAARGEPAVVVVDRFEHATGADVAEGLDYLLAQAGPWLRLVLITRTEPLLPLHRYRADGRIAEIRARDLAFTPGEAARLLRGHGLELGDDAVRALTERTGGWAAGLRLAALAAGRADDPEVYLKDFEAGETTIADFMAAEVLAGQSAEARDLMLRTSILEQTHVELADELTGRRDAGRILDQLAHTNAFVEPIGRRWYRHHPLFAEILRYRLRAQDPGLERELHRRAARWLYANGRPDAALPHAAAGGDWESAAERFIEDLSVGRLFVGLKAARLRSWFARMPPDTPGACPDLVRAALALVDRDAGRALPYLTAAERSLTENPGRVRATSLTYAFLRVLVAALTGSADDAHHWAAAFDALRHWASTDPTTCHPEMIGLLHTALGSACLWEGRFDQARRALTHTAGLSREPVAAAARQDAESRLALIDLLQGPSGPARARDRARAAILEAGRYGLPDSCTGVAYLVLARIAFERDELPAARADLETADASGAAAHDPIMAAGLAVTRSRLLLADGDPAAALDALAPTGPTGRGAAVEHPSPWARSEAAEAASAALLAQGDAAAAAAAAAREAGHDPACAVALAGARLAAGDPPTLSALDAAVSADAMPPPVAVRSLLVRATAAHRAGDEGAAVRRLTEALELARPECLRRPFRETGPWVRRVLRAHANLAEAHGWLEPDAHPYGRRPAEAPPGSVDGLIIEPLSAREREILERAAEMLSTREIADALYLSVNTVKTHLKNINRKLCATRRAEAVRRAKQLRML
jgi:LuxR family transcriptional regulator, maltose regulon positive regulatory protein